MCRGLFYAGASGRGTTALDELLWDLLTRREVAVFGAIFAGVYEDEAQLEIYCTNQLSQN